MKIPRQAKPVIRIPAPIHESIGLGDAVKSVTQRLGFDPCKGCDQRAAALNSWVAFTPYRGMEHR